MTVLVTGGAGYIGSHTVHALVDAGERGVVLDNLSTGFAAALPARMLPIVGCVGDQTLVAELIEDHAVESIIHFAGSNGLDQGAGVRCCRNSRAGPRAHLGTPSDGAGRFQGPRGDFGVVSALIRGP
jgi:NAD(P)-dependent dehydrogenase (short-subunit alcohol dehydrogenase family)